MKTYTLIVIGLLFTTGSLLAQVDHTVDQCIAKYGTPVSDHSITDTQEQIRVGLRIMVFNYGKYQLTVSFLGDRASSICSRHLDDSPFTDIVEDRSLLDDTCPVMLGPVSAWGRYFMDDGKLYQGLGFGAQLMDDSKALVAVDLRREHAFQRLEQTGTTRPTMQETENSVR